MVSSRARVDAYVSLVQEFSSRSVLFHAAVAGRLGLHVTDLKSLRLLGSASATAGELARWLSLSGPSVTALIDRLEAAGFVVRKRSLTDRRRVEVHAVAEAARRVDELYLGQYARMSTLLADYSEAEFRAICDFLRRTSGVLAEETEHLRRQGARPRTPAAEPASADPDAAHSSG